jgi:ParB family chromosome partitioning protein
MTTDKARRLGRGLEALLGSPLPTTTSAREPQVRGDLHRIPIAEIRPNPFQPRRAFDPQELAGLESSIRANGLLQPISVRPAPTGVGYELIAGERRLRAATRIGWTEIQALIRELDDRALLTLALVENLQRTDLDPLEEAEGYHRLMQEFELTQQQVADVVGKDRSTVANILRLLSLPASIRRFLQTKEITLGHARALLSIGDEREMSALAQRIVQEGLTVRQVEALARPAAGPAQGGRKRAAKAAVADTPVTRRIESELRRYLQTDVRITLAEGERGQIGISFYSADDLERLLDLVLGQDREQM